MSVGTPLSGSRRIVARCGCRKLGRASRAPLLPAAGVESLRVSDERSFTSARKEVTLRDSLKRLGPPSGPLLGAGQGRLLSEPAPRPRPHLR